MKTLRFFLAPFGILYWSITSLRNWLYQKKIFRSLSFSLPIINVGNLSVGGTGKTPHVELIIRILKDSNKITTLSRGYGRKVYGFQMADQSSTALSIGDEPYQFYRKFGDEINVAVDADRVNGVSEICLRDEGVEVIILDDAFQHHSIKPGLNILLTDYSAPFFNDFILPVGNLRESRKGKSRGDIIIVTKCPDDLSDEVKLDFVNQIAPNPAQHMFFSSVVYGDIKSLTNFSKWEKNTESIVLVTGIAKSEPLVQHLSESFNIIKHFKFPDHYRFKEKDIDEIHNILTKFVDDFPVIITTEKDAMRLLNGPLQSKIDENPWYYQEIEVKLDDQEKFDRVIKEYVQENSRDY